MPRALSPRKINVSKESLATADAVSSEESYFFEPIRLYFITSQEEDAHRHQWSGGISPSSKLYFGMCMSAYFERVQKPLKFKDDTLMNVRAGTMWHEALFKQSMRADRLLYPKPNYTDPSLVQWLEKSWPEVPISCPKSGVRGKVDAVIYRGDDIGVVDLKCVWQTEKQWLELLRNKTPQHSHLVQVSIYVNRLNALKAYDKRIKWGCVAYMNMLKKPFSKNSYVECWFEYDDHIREKTNLLLKHLSKGRKQAIAGERVVCEYPRCPEHA